MADVLQEFEDDPALGEEVAHGEEVLAEQMNHSDRYSDTAGSPEGVALGALARYEAFTELEVSLLAGTIGIDDTSPSEQSLALTSDHPSHATVYVVQWGEDEWVIEGFAHQLPDSECAE